MSRNGSGIFSLPAIYKAETGDLIVADQHNSPLEDIKDDLNAARPIVAGGTGATTASGARSALSVPSVSDVQTGYVPKVASKTDLSALDTASFKAAVVTEATREKLWMWKTGDFSTAEAADTDHVNYIAANGVSTSLGCWVAATGDGVTVRTIAAGGTGADNASGARDNLGLGSAATTDASAYATAAQGVLADGAVQSAATDASSFGFTSNDTTLAGDSAGKLTTEHAVVAYVAGVVKKYATNTVASGANGASSLAAGTVFETDGRSASGDGGGGQWIVEGADAGSTLKLDLNGSGKFGRSLERVLRPQQFGAVKGGTNQEQAFVDLASELRWRAANGGGVRVEFDDYADYGVYDTRTPDGSVVMDISGVKGLKLRMNGSRFLSANPFSTAGFFFLFFGQDVVDLELDHPTLHQTAALTFIDGGGKTAIYEDRGFYGVYLGGASRGIRIHEQDQIGGNCAVAVVPVVSGSYVFDQLTPASGIEITGKSDSTFYGLNFRYNGHHVTGKWTAKRVGRIYFPYNVHHHKMMLDTEPGATNECILIKTYADGSAARPNWYNRTTDIEAHIFCRGAASNAPQNVSLAQIAMQQINGTDTNTFAEMSNIKLVFNVDNAAANSLGRLLTTQRRKTDASEDLTGHSYIVNDIDVSGTWWNTAGMTTPLINLFNPSTEGDGASVGDWSGDNVSNIRIHDVQQITAGDWNINSGVIKNGLTLERIRATAANLTLVGSKAVLDASNAVSFANFNSASNGGLTAGNQGYRRLPNGRVEMFGVVNAATNANTAFTFPLTVSQVEEVKLTPMVSGNAGAVNAVSITGTGMTITATSTFTGGNVAWSVAARI